MTSQKEDRMDPNQSITGKNDSIYEIKIKGLLDDHWQLWFEGMTLSVEENVEAGEDFTLLIGPIADQPALHGILEKIRDLNLPLISVRILARTDTNSNGQKRNAETEDPRDG